MTKRCWYCGEGLGVAHYCATDIKGVYCDADCLEAQRNKVRSFAAPKQEAGEWVDVNDELPGFNQRVLICNRLGWIDVAALVKTPNSGFEWHRGTILLPFTDISHWQPLPAPPVVQKDESGRCGDCRYWDNLMPGGEFGRCQLLTFNSSPFVSDTARSQGGVAGQPVRTNKGFGCLEFQAKDA